MRPPSPNNKNGSTSTTFKMTRESTSTAFKMALVIMEQYQRNQQMMLENQRNCMKTFMEQQKMQTKLLIDTIQRKNGRLKINSTQLMNNLGKQNNVSETRTDDRNTATTTEKPVPRYWLDWVEKRKQNEQKRREERANDGTTNDHIEYIDGAKYEWKPGTIALPQTADIATTFPASSNYFKCLEENNDPTTVEPTLSRTDESLPPTEAKKSQAKRVSKKATKKKVEFTSEVVTEVQTRPKFDNEKALSQPKEEEIQN